MFNPFSRTRTPGFNVRPQDDVRGFRLDPEVLDPEAEVPGFNIDENGLLRPRSLLGSGSSVQPTPPQVTADPVVLAWLRGSLALPQPWTPPGLRWPPAGGLAVGPAETTATMREPDEPDAVPESGPDAANSTAAVPRDDDEVDPQAGVSGPGARSIGVPPLPAVPPSADPNFVLANADGDVQEAQQTRPSTRSTPPPTPPAQTAPATGRRQMPPLKREMSGEELSQLEERRREEALNEAFLYKPRREERARYWNDMIRALPIPNRLSTLKSPALPDSKIQQPLSPDWRADVRKLNPNHLDYTEAAAKKYSIPPELLARLLYRASNYKNQGVDSNGNALPRRAMGIPQMYPQAYLPYIFLGDPSRYDRPRNP